MTTWVITVELEGPNNRYIGWDGEPTCLEYAAEFSTREQALDFAVTNNIVVVAGWHSIVTRIAEGRPYDRLALRPFVAWTRRL